MKKYIDKDKNINEFEFLSSQIIFKKSNEADSFNSDIYCSNLLYSSIFKGAHLLFFSVSLDFLNSS